VSEPPKLPKELEAIADKVLAYRPKPKSKAAKKRKKAGKAAAKMAAQRSAVSPDIQRRD
jgi:hypothetical protein